MDQVEEIKSKIDIVDLIQSYIPLKKRGKNFWANCPFHGEKTPSFTVSPDLQIFKCFGCGKAGDIFTFVQEYEKIEFREALELLAKRAGITLKSNPALSTAEKISQKIIIINQFTSLFYHYVLTKHPQGAPALKYLKNRGIKDDTIKLFKIGFSPDDSRQLLNFLKSKGFSLSDILQTGTFGQKGSYTYDRFRHRLVFPLVDHRDRIVGFSGRILTADKNLAKYINSPETPVYHKGHMFFGLNLTKDFIRKADSAIVVEGEFDLISPFQAGFQNIVALKGTAFTSDQLTLLKRYTQNLILALDSDFAGANAARKSIQLADSLGFNIKAVDLKNFKDPDEAVKNDLSFFKKQINDAQSIWDFIISSALKTYPSATDLGKKQILEFTFPFITQIDNSVIKSTYLTKLANLLNVDREAVFSEADKFSKNANIDQKTNISLPVQADPQNPLKTEKMEHYLLVLLFSHPQPKKFFKQVSQHFDIISLPQFTKIIGYLKKYKLKTFSASKFVKILPPESVELFNSIYIESQNDSPDEILLKKQIAKTSANINLAKLKQFQHQLSAKIAQAEQQRKLTRLKKLQQEYDKLLNQIATFQSKI